MNKDEAWKYFITDSERKSIATKYAIDQIKCPSNSYWLMTSYTSDLYKYLVSPDGSNQNNPRVNEDEGIRPVIWVKSDALNIE